MGSGAEFIYLDSKNQTQYEPTGEYKDIPGQGGLSHLAGTTDKYHFLVQILQDMLLIRREQIRQR